VSRRRALSLTALAHALALALALAAPSRAHAYEDQLGVSLGAGYSLIPGGAALPEHGFVLQAGAGIGLGDVWELRFHGAWALQVADAPLHRVVVGAEIVYLVDILEWVPFLGIGISAPISIPTDASAIRGDFAVQGVVGLDWLPAREWAFGIEIRPYLNVTGMLRAPGDPIWLTFVARAQYLFEI
jgi:hypothetical protein